MKMRAAVAFVAALSCSGCTAVNMPAGDAFPIAVTSPQDIKVFADANGTLYPSGWKDRISARRVRSGRSLLNGADSSERAWIEQQHRAQLDQLERSIAASDRVFILTHGFNIDETDAGTAFNHAIRQIAPRPRDLVLRLHWDGMLGSGAGAGAVWFPAVGYSQMVGLRALRPIINRTTDKNIYLVSHSRGASVILSALASGGVPFDPKFRRATQALSDRFNLSRGLLDPEPILERGNRIHAIFLGPAVGYPDFWQAECEPGSGQTCNQPTDCNSYRAFSPQLRSIQHTLNAGDDTLRKKIAVLSPNFNATNLGWDARVGATLNRCYDKIGIRATAIAQPHRHSFSLYAQDPELRTMLRSAFAFAAGSQAQND